MLASPDTLTSSGVSVAENQMLPRYAGVGCAWMPPHVSALNQSASNVSVDKTEYTSPFGGHDLSKPE